MILKKEFYVCAAAIALFAFLLISFLPQAVSAAEEKLTNKQVKDLIATGKTPADQMKLAKHFEAKADELASEAREHAQLSDQYRHTGELASDDLQPHYFADYADHCKRLAAKLSEAADAARELSHDHQKMAQQERK